MANYYLDFVGLNTFIYEPVGYDPDNQTGGNSNLPGLEDITDNFSKIVEQNTIGSTSKIFNLYEIGHFKNYLFTHELPNTASFFPALMLQRNGPYGFPTF